MKGLLCVSVLCFALHNAAAETPNSTATNQIFFPVLLSTNESVLMTNAEFRCTQGVRVFFRDGDVYHAFYAAEIDTNQLALLGITLAKLSEDQTKLDAERQQLAQEMALAQAQAAQQPAPQEQTESNNQTNQTSTATSPAKKPAQKLARMKHNK